ncbi:MAG: tRNA pseudouridine(55) synthase TruB [Candidatus Binatia bacterium]
MNGIWLIDKPDGLTSADVVRCVKQRLPRGSRVGHLGTLDPFATGLLPLCVGEATKIATFLNTADKRYEGVIQLGAATDTGDRTGRVIRHAPVAAYSASELAAVARRFTGDLLQRPPMYSALKRDGVPLYRLARRGLEVEREPRSVRIDVLSLAAEPGGDRLRFDVACSKGTYVRVLAEDIGAALGSAAHLSALRRTHFGRFTIGAAVPLAEWAPERSEGFLSVREALRHLPAFQVEAAVAQAAHQGQSWVMSRLPATDASQGVLVDPAGEVVAVVARIDGQWRYARVLVNLPLHGMMPVVAGKG